MSSKLHQEYVTVISDALREINEMFGYEVFDSSIIDKTARNFLKLLPIVETELKSKRGVTLQDVEKEKHDYEKAKDMVIRGILHGSIFKNYKGNSFEEKIKDYLYSSGTEICEWIGKTDYISYFNTMMNKVSKLVMDIDATKYILNFLNESTRSRSQAIMTLILTKPDFFKDSQNYDEKTIDDHIEIFKMLSGVAEKMFKLIYAIINIHWTLPTPPDLEKEELYGVLKAVRKDAAFNVLAKAVPDTIGWNASKHIGYNKFVGSKQVKFTSNEGIKTLTYADFISRVRELYACTLVLTKISLMIALERKSF